ncbi:MAG: toll/interleukin-1 receptor domain-containing protein [Oscillospiraceae bacterium]|nr:toll/interleukin-1 receptor domain-containing protein [Oscillospiraceae bacterium]
MTTKRIRTPHGEKRISVYCCDITKFPRKIDILTTSAFQGSYYPTPGTMFYALQRIGISVWELAQQPATDLRKLCNVWLSEEIPLPASTIKRIGCVEMSSFVDRPQTNAEAEKKMLRSISSYFRMLDIAALNGVPMETVALPLLGAGCQQIQKEMLVMPILNECLSLLERNEAVKEICFIEYNPTTAYTIASAVDRSYSVRDRETDFSPAPPASAVEQGEMMAFLSHASEDRNVIMNLCAKLEARGMKAWYAPRNIQGGDYASSIVEAIRSSSHFVLIISKNSLGSQHVLNEIALAFGEIGRRNMKFHLLRLDDEEMGPSFQYYLERQHWMDGRIPPLERQLEAFVDSIFTT